MGPGRTLGRRAGDTDIVEPRRRLGKPRVLLTLDHGAHHRDNVAGHRVYAGLIHVQKGFQGDRQRARVVLVGQIDVEKIVKSTFSEDEIDVDTVVRGKLAVPIPDHLLGFVDGVAPGVGEGMVVSGHGPFGRMRDDTEAFGQDPQSDIEIFRPVQVWVESARLEVYRSQPKGRLELERAFAIVLAEDIGGVEVLRRNAFGDHGLAVAGHASVEGRDDDRLPRGRSLIGQRLENGELVAASLVGLQLSSASCQAMSPSRAASSRRLRAAPRPRFVSPEIKVTRSSREMNCATI